VVGLDFGTASVTNDEVASLDDQKENSQKGDEENDGRGPVEQKRVLLKN
jgi:hypothetical protein